MLRTALIIGATVISTGAYAQNAEVSVAAGERISIIGGCHDCHSPGYEQAGKIDPATALKGSPVGFNGPWGTTYPANLRLTAAGKSEDEWVAYLKTIQTAPPMPWFNLHAFTEAESRSLHQYILSLGEPGDAAPKMVPPGQTPTTPYISFVPVMPK